ncbi:sugar ABC transporter ATP-binding protein [Roseisalinus antarcticus]|uniref:Ribose import ATP-binding protein RbsA n=1 Tax=Roseisalinus antarcticus TaxID=254357 RepID=A0A1Y5RUM6_9RHOB|nr:sugar ABC transporter ATP-binding protein [Roseisalinus antarcticus]SLN25515.1 Ribose import ATP-binding protein RbsA [Roseisalinus antarcticus]
MSSVDTDRSAKSSAVRENAPPTVHLRHVSKTFGATLALDDVSIEVHPGEVHGLLGTNGSGKSTLIKVLAGFHAPDAGGSMKFNGEDVRMPLQPSDFRRLGMSFVHQNLGLVPSLTVLENLRLSHIALARGGFINWPREKAAATATLERYGLDIPHWRRIDELSAVNRALVAIIRAFEDIREECERTGKPGLVLLDEPTPFLPGEGVARLFDLVRQIVATGSSVIFISHDIDEVMEITDRVTVLRDGKVSGEIDTADATRDRMVELIIGRTLVSGASVPADRMAVRKPFAAVKGLGSPSIPPLDLTIGKGEILGLTGLIGSGFDQIPYLLFGADNGTTGTLQIEDAPPVALSTRTPAKSIESGFALLPGDRMGRSGVGSIPIYENMLLPDIDAFFRGFVLRGGAMRRKAYDLGRDFEVRPNDPQKNLAALSGGNAQKVLIARWMNLAPKLLMLDEPTQGVDVGTRANIFAALKAASDDGMSILCASSDAEQLAEICHRVLVFARGRLVEELVGADVNKDRIASACFASLEAVPSTRSQNNQNRTGVPT